MLTRLRARLGRCLVRRKPVPLVRAGGGGPDGVSAEPLPDGRVRLLVRDRHGLLVWSGDLGPEAVVVLCEDLAAATIRAASLAAASAPAAR